MNYEKYNRMLGVFDTPPPYDCEYLVIAGGGGSLTDAVGGGQTSGAGAGGYRSNVSGEDSGGGASAENALSLSAGTYSIIIGAGGAANASNGSNSTFDQITSIGGGRGSGVNGNGAGDGGSGGGAGASGSAGSGTANQGYNGQSTSENSGIGGGAGASGSSGGGGVASEITGSSVTRAAGGIGGETANQGSDGAPNTGDGATGVRYDNGGRSGGSGVVIFTLPIGAIVNFSGGVTQTSATVGVNRVYTVTATSTTSETVTIS